MYQVNNDPHKHTAVASHFGRSRQCRCLEWTITLRRTSRPKGLPPVARIPTTLREHIDTAYPAHTCLVATVLPNGFAQVSPRGSTMVFDDEHIALWERGRGSTSDNLQEGSKVTVYFSKPELRASGVLPRGGVARFYGTATIHRSGATYDEIWERLIEVEKSRDPEKRGYGVLIAVERAEDLAGNPLNLD